MHFRKLCAKDSKYLYYIQYNSAKLCQQLQVYSSFLWSYTFLRLAMAPFRPRLYSLERSHCSTALGEATTTQSREATVLQPRERHGSTVEHYSLESGHGLTALIVATALQRRVLPRRYKLESGHISTASRRHGSTAFHPTSSK